MGIVSSGLSHVMVKPSMRRSSEIKRSLESPKATSKVQPEKLQVPAIDQHRTHPPAGSEGRSRRRYGSWETLFFLYCIPGDASLSVLNCRLSTSRG
ncbi:unnamed protein product [Euphydryas editha]|uniref:Uncharacterized protein n=1 Tax=Euphydryas editha TaxID=104508 RepID=A0AAU9V1W3_EUPED|nr:unnamed protein product [Euphydryas editha]